MFNGKIFPRKQYGTKTDGRGKEVIKNICSSILLNEFHVGLNLDELSKLYPYERKEENA